MCGLVGATGKLRILDEAAIKRLLFLDFLRGSDATGLASIYTDGDVAVVKRATHVINFFDSKEFEEKIHGGKTDAWIGHNRAATRGKSNDNNAHPFQYGDITGAHNGTLCTKSWKALEEAVGKSFDVDSQALIYAIDKLGIEAAIGLCFTGDDSVTGAWSLVWHDAKDGSINFLRNEHRPMWLAYSEDMTQLFWASEYWMLDAALHHIGKYSLYKDEQNCAYFPTEIDVHYKFLIDDFKSNTSKLPVVASTQPIKGKELPKFKADPFGREYGMDRSRTTAASFPGTKNGTTSTTTSPGKRKIKNLLQMWGNEDLPFAGYIGPETFNQIGKHGCAWCSDYLEFEAIGMTIFEKEGVVLCPKCSMSGKINKVYAIQEQFDALASAL